MTFSVSVIAGPISKAEETVTFCPLSDLSEAAQSHNQSLLSRSPSYSLRRPPLLLRDCVVSNSNTNVRFATKPQRISCTQMHTIFFTAKTIAFYKVMATGERVDRPLGPEELPFEYDGKDRAMRYYTDVDQTPGSVLTWEHVFRAYDGLINCVFREQLYFAIYFEIWEIRPGNQPQIQLGSGEFGMFHDGPFAPH
ncbi:MAG: hypothetical protein Q9171_007119 [Xanthocarpia ochracea]